MRRDTPSSACQCERRLSSELANQVPHRLPESEFQMDDSQSATPASELSAQTDEVESADAKKPANR